MKGKGVSFSGDIDEDAANAFALEYRRQSRAGAGQGGKGFNMTGLAGAYLDPGSIPRKGGGEDGWGGWGGSWSSGGGGMKKGGLVRGCGCAKRGKTKGRFV